MTTAAPSQDELARIDQLVEHYRNDYDTYGRFLEQLRGVLEFPKLRALYHSLRWRLKDAEHLHDKLVRKLARAKTGDGLFDITPETLFESINDLAGLRILHLHTTEFPRIDSELRELLAEHRYSLVEGPVARVWDDEYREYFEGVGVPTVRSERMYTSVHYVVGANTRTKRTAEIQVRTLAEELWGEVDHTINYPVPSPRLACREQIKVLARVTSSCTRLVDSIFVSQGEQIGND